MTQVAVPVADLFTTGYSDAAAGTTSLYASLDEYPFSDADYVASASEPTDDPLVFRLTGLQDPVTSSEHLLRYRIGKGTSAGIVSLDVELRQGYQHEGSQGLLIASWHHGDISSDATTVSSELTEAETDAIENYADLFLRLRFTQ